MTGPDHATIFGLGDAVTVSAPASSANLGCGFDCFGLALDFWLTLTVTAAPTFAVTLDEPLDAAGIHHDGISCGPDNLIVRSFLGALRHLGYECDEPRFHFHIHNRIPLTRGLGSSAAAIVAGIGAAYSMCGYDLDEPLVLQEIGNLGSRVERHPDNVLPCALGGLQIGVRRAGRPEPHTAPAPEPNATVCAQAQEPRLLAREPRAPGADSKCGGPSRRTGERMPPQFAKEPLVGACPGDLSKAPARDCCRRPGAAASDLYPEPELREAEPRGPEPRERKMAAIGAERGAFPPDARSESGPRSGAGSRSSNGGGEALDLDSNNDAYFMQEVPFPQDCLDTLVFIPKDLLETKHARAILPTQISADDAIHNIGRAALLIAALTLRDFRGLREAVEDRLHQPYREGACPTFARIRSLLPLVDGGLAAYLSGAGPATVVWCEKGRGEAVARRLEEVCPELRCEGEFRSSRVVARGLRLVARSRRSAPTAVVSKSVSTSSLFANDRPSTTDTRPGGGGR